MIELAPVIQAVEEVVITPGPMVFPPIMFGVITLVVLVVLMGVTFAFRNMADAHPKNPTVTKYEPVGHPGQPIIEPVGSNAPAAERTAVESGRGETR